MPTSWRLHLTGEQKKTYGARTYPVEYTYDYAGRMQTLKTWQNFAGNAGTATTTWNYSTNRGFLLAKQYDDGNGPTYTYTSAGRLATRVWARGSTTTYTYDYAGQLTGTAYDDGITPTATTTYDRRGRTTSVGDGTLTATRAYNEAGQLLGESYAGGVLDGLSITNTYDAYLRRTNLSALSPLSSLLSSTSYAYDSASRLATVSDGTNNATYGYLANSALVDSIVFKQNSTTRMVRTNRYDYLNRLTSVVTGAPGSAPAASFAYAYNDANQRVAVTNADSSRWSWGYDSLGQVTSGKRYWSDNSVVAGQQFEYAFDTIGNRTSASSGGDQYGSSLRTQTYGANTLNQYTNRTVPAYLEVQGSANSSATVTVNNDTVYRKGEYFRKELSVNNSSAAIWQGITNVAVLAGAGTNGSDIVTTQSGNLLLPQTPESFTYDADGNMTSDGKFTYTWDAENRLLAAESLTNAPSASRVRTEWNYQPDGRWNQRVASVWNTSTLNYQPSTTNRFVWDGKVLLSVLDGNDQTIQAYLRGSDMSGSMARAGGVGGLLAVSAGTNGVHFAAFDGNGNVSALLSANSSTLTASYEYGPFGETVRATGPMAQANSLRFSTQFADDVTGQLKYLYREYLSELGRWVSRDPIHEIGFQISWQKHFLIGKLYKNVGDIFNSYCIIQNETVSKIDILGLYGNPVCGPDGQCYYSFPWNPPPPPSPGGVNFQGCEGALSASEKQQIEQKIQQAINRLNNVSNGGIALPTGLTTGMADCIRGKLNGFTFKCASKCNPWCLIKDGFTYNLIQGASTTTINLCVSTIKINNANSGPMNFVLSTMFHELTHACGKNDENSPDNPDSWGGFLGSSP